MKAFGPTPHRALTTSFLGLILAGTLLLSLPLATPAGRHISLVDALFTSTSATCVTGLVVRDTGTGFTLFGQVVILLLIQLGGIGIMTFSLMVMVLFGGRFSFASRQILFQTFTGGGESVELWPLLRIVARFTVACEALGALLLFARWSPALGAREAAWAAVFHSVSAFCNAGFGLWPDSLTRWRGDVFTNLIVCALIVLGGIGFLVSHELFERRHDRRRLSLHTRLVLVTTGVLIVAGSLGFWSLEHHTLLAGMPARDAVLASLFQSVTARTAGFNTVDIGALGPATLFLIMILMGIGGSPGSTAGGIKTTTVAVLVLTGWNRLKRRTHVNAFRRTIPPNTINTAISVLLGGLVVLLIGLLLILAIEEPHAAGGSSHERFRAYIFETISALGTVGLSTGLTPLLSPASRVVTAVLMFIGRLGPLTVAMSIARGNPVTDWQHPEEDVIVG